jgi:hypothetical protein
MAPSLALIAAMHKCSGPLTAWKHSHEPFDQIV